ncbi:MAG: deoxyribonuclease IV [Phycisphaerae bacterium]|nr:deoxyribonuclease IV [Phycisphaerae bacterium]
MPQKKVTRTARSGSKRPADHAGGPRLGAHLSVAGGLHLACERAREVGCDALQVFVKNQRQWHAGPLREEQILAFRGALQGASIAPVVAHAAYLINLAAPDAQVRKRSIDAMVDELNRCAQLGIVALVVHPGAHLDRSLEEGIATVANSLNEIIRQTAGGVRILLEATAGQGSSIGHRFEHLRDILAGVTDRARMGICLDTCHLFAAGYDFRSAESYGAMMDELNRVIGATLVHCIHVNDSKKDLGSRVDRHEHIGKGRIGKAAFAHFLNDTRLAGLPFILETPKGKDRRGTDLDKVNLRCLRSLLQG